VNDPLNLVRLTALMEVTSGRPEIAIGLIDGPVLVDHPELNSENVRGIDGSSDKGRCGRVNSVACMHGTFIAGILSAKRGSAAPAICPGCTLLVRPIFLDTVAARDLVPSAKPAELAAAIVECVDAGARLVNLSAALALLPSAADERALKSALDYAAGRGVIVVAAAGNQALVGSSVITRHPWVIPVVGSDWRGRPLRESNLAHSTAERGQRAPGEGIASLSADGTAVPAGGTSVAAPFVTGAIALVWSECPDAGAARVRLAIRQAYSPRPRTVVPPLLNAWAIHEAMNAQPSRS
jgi:subtilisin family serine protease